MESNPITKNWGLMITSTKSEQLLELDKNKIISLFDDNGVLIFRGFDLNRHDITKFTDLFTERYARSDYRRSRQSTQTLILDADYWRDDHQPNDMPLHSDASFAPVWPEIIWFYCQMPPDNKGATTLCDGMELWGHLSSEIKLFFLSEPILYSVAIRVPDNLKKGEGEKPWPTNIPGVSGHLNWDSGLINLKVLRYASNRARYSDQLCFSNHLLAEIDDEPQIREITMASGKVIPERFIDEIKHVSHDIVIDHSWQRGDLLMIDNMRFLHGRRAFEKCDSREILTVQTARASFGFGFAPRTQVN